MATLKSRVEDLVGAITDTDALSQWLMNGAKIVINLMPEDVLEENSVAVSVTAGGLATGEYRIHSGNKNGYNARRLPANMRAKVQDATSIHYALPTDPAMIIYNGKVYIFPSGGTLLKVNYPTIISTTATTAGLQSKFDQIIVYYAAIQHLLGTMILNLNDLLDLEDNLPTVPTTISAPSFSVSNISISDLDIYPEVDALTPPTFTKPTFGGDFATLSTPLDTNQDIELASGHINRLKTYLEKFGIDIQNEVNEFNKEYAKFKADLEVALVNLDKSIKVAVQNQNKELQLEIEEYRSTLSKYQADIGKYQAEVNVYATKVRARIEAENGKMGLFDRLKGEYGILLEIHLGVRNDAR